MVRRWKWRWWEGAWSSRRECMGWPPSPPLAVPGPWPAPPMTPYRLGHPLLTGPVSGRVMELKSELMSFLGSYMKSQNISTAGDERAKGLGGCTCCRRLLQLGGGHPLPDATDPWIPSCSRATPPKPSCSKPDGRAGRGRAQAQAGRHEAQGCRVRPAASRPARCNFRLNSVTACSRQAVKESRAASEAAAPLLRSVPGTAATRAALQLPPPPPPVPVDIFGALLSPTEPNNLAGCRATQL